MLLSSGVHSPHDAQDHVRELAGADTSDVSGSKDQKYVREHAVREIGVREGEILAEK